MKRSDKLGVGRWWLNSSAFYDVSSPSKYLDCDNQHQTILTHTGRQFSLKIIAGYWEAPGKSGHFYHMSRIALIPLFVHLSILHFYSASFSISSLSFKARGLKFCIQTSHINAKKSY